MTVCPSCGSDCGDRVIVSCDRFVAFRGEVKGVAPNEAVVIQELNKRYPSVVSPGQIISALWGRTQGPEWQDDAVRIYIHRSRKSLPPGVEICAKRKEGYYLRIAA